MNPFAYFTLRRWRKKVRKLARQLADRRHVDDDILAPEAAEELRKLENQARMLSRTADVEGMRAFTETLPHQMGKILPEERFGWLRGWLDLIAVVCMVAGGIRGLFFQPFAIPTSSMQPTLYGIHYIEDAAKTNSWIGQLPQPLDWLLFSTRRAELTTEKPGRVEQLSSFSQYHFLDNTRLDIGGVNYTLPGAPAKVAEYADLRTNYRYPAQTTLCDGFLSSGDHLFVDRVSFHLTGLSRGDIVVFTTDDIYDENRQPLAKTSGYFYIKRLVGLPGDTLKISQGMLMLKPDGAADFRPITDFSPVFAKLYSGKGGYQNHSIYLAGRRTGNYLSREEEEFLVPPDSFFLLGDNVNFSSDGRIWGTVPRRNVVGRAWVVFWPLSRRWGWIDTAEPVEAPTGYPGRSTFRVMGMQ